MPLDPCLFGWARSNNGLLQPVMTTKTCAVPELLQDTVCECSESCVESNNCPCDRNEQSCTPECVYQAFLPFQNIDDEDNVSSQP